MYVKKVSTVLTNCSTMAVLMVTCKLLSSHLAWEKERKHHNNWPTAKKRRNCRLVRHIHITCISNASQNKANIHYEHCSHKIQIQWPAHIVLAFVYIRPIHKTTTCVHCMCACVCAAAAFLATSPRSDGTIKSPGDHCHRIIWMTMNEPGIPPKKNTQNKHNYLNIIQFDALCVWTSGENLIWLCVAGASVVLYHKT